MYIFAGSSCRPASKSFEGEFGLVRRTLSNLFPKYNLARLPALTDIDILISFPHRLEPGQNFYGESSSVVRFVILCLDLGSFAASFRSPALVLTQQRHELSPSHTTHTGVRFSIREPRFSPFSNNFRHQETVPSQCWRSPLSPKPTYRSSFPGWAEALVWSSPGGSRLLLPFWKPWILT